MFDVRLAVQTFWAIVQTANHTDAYRRAKFTRDDVLQWRSHPLLLKVHVANKGTIFVGARGAVEFRSDTPGAGSLDVFCDHPDADVTLELQVENDYVCLEDLDRVIKAARAAWPGIIVSYV